jgi:hypothetical protein
VTVATAYGTNTTAQAWGIGGKRATMGGSVQLFTDWGLGWIVDQQSGETITSTITMVGPTPNNSTLSPILTSTTFTTWGTQPVIQTSTSSLVMFKVGTTGIIIRNLSFKNTAATKSDCFQALPSNGVDITWSNCIFDGFVQALNGSNAVPNNFHQCIVECCEVKNCTGAGGGPSAVSFNQNGSGFSCHVYNCYFHNNGGALNMGGSGSITGGYVHGCVFANNSGAPPVTIAVGNSSFKNNSLYNCGTGNTLPAVSFGVGAATVGVIAIENNIFVGNAGYAVVFAGGNVPTALLFRNNAYFGNNGNGTGLDLQNVSYGPGDISLTANPFVSTSTPDWGLNSAVGGGAACRGKASTVPGASANLAGDLGAIPSGGGGAAAGGLLRYPGMTANING